MPNAPFENFRLVFMQDFLPVGIAIVERVRKGGIAEVREVFDTADDPVAQLRNEGDSAASVLRQKLDDINPGLGNPVMEVKVSVEEEIDPPQAFSLNESKLFPILQRIEERIDLLKEYLDSKD